MVLFVDWRPVIVIILTLCALFIVLVIGYFSLRKIGFCAGIPCNEYEAFRQITLRKLGWKFYTLRHCNHFRHKGVARFAWAIPNATAIQTIIKSVPPLSQRPERGLIIDFGSGKGYWARQISLAIVENRVDIDVIAIEKNLNFYATNEDGSIGGSTAHEVKQSDLWFPVRRGDIELLIEMQKVRRVHTLLLVWPPCWEDMAFCAVQAFRGDCVIYVGEAEGGCTV